VCSLAGGLRLTPEQIDHARKPIGKGETRQYVADLLQVGHSTLYAPSTLVLGGSLHVVDDENVARPLGRYES
jgi:hypothetical protein